MKRVQGPSNSRPTPYTTLFATIISLLLAAFIIIVGILASVPPISRDALTHHLYIPKLYLQHGGIHEIPSIVFSYFPMNLDMLYLLPLALGNDIAPKYIHCAFALFTALLILFYLSNRLTLIYGLLGALFFLSIPIILKLSITAYVDLGLIFFSTAAILLIFQWLNNTSKFRYLFAGALCCGLALGTKYNGLITLFLLTSFIPILYIRARPKSQVGAGYIGLLYAALFAVITLLVFSPWALRNYIWTDNPFYPLFSSSDTAVMGGMNQFVLRKFLYNESWWQTLLIPIRIFLEGRDNSPQFFDGQLNPFLLLLPPLAFIPLTLKHKSINREKLALVFFAILFLLFAFFKRELRIRYIGPVIPPLVVLSIFGLYNLISYARQQENSSLRKAWFLAACCLTVSMLSLNFSYLVKQIRIVKPFDYLSGNVSRSQYISQFRPEYPTIEYANQNLGTESKLLCIFLGNRGYYINREHSFDLQKGTSTLCSIGREVRAPEEIAKRLSQLHFTHLFIREDLWQHWIRTKLSKEQLLTMTAFMNKSTTILYHKNGYTLYQITEAPFKDINVSNNNG